MLPSISHAVGGVKVNGVATCVSSTNMSLDPAGDLVIACTAPGTGSGGGPTTAPSCTINVSASPINAGQSTTITAICNPAATSYAWTATGPAISSSGGTVIFPTAGSYNYTVTGTNSIGSGAASSTATVVVNTASTPTPGACSNPKPVTGSFTANGIRNLSIDRGASVSYQVPAYTQVGRTLEILSIGSTSSQQDLTSEFSVSECPGDFDTMQPECKTWGTVNQSGTQLYATTNATVVNGTCTVILGKPFYINVRNTKYDRVTPACTPQTCYMILQLNSY